MGKKVDASGDISGRYEWKEVKPSVEIATKIEETLGVSLDYLTGLSDVELDKNIVETIINLQNLKPEDQKDILTTLNALICDAKARSAYA